MFGIIKKMFIVLAASIANASTHTKCMSLSNQICESQPLLLLIYILMNTIKNYATIYFRLN